MLPFLEALGRTPLVLDGAMGTELHARGFPFTRCYEALNLEEPELIREIHRGHVAAGADVLETNTFGASGPRLARRGLEGRVRDLNRAAVENARAAGARYVAGAIGPIGVPDEGAFREQADALAEAGADALIVETMRHAEELVRAVAAAKSTGLPVVALANFDAGGTLADGTTPEQLAARLSGADVIGANCSDDLVAIAERLARVHPAVAIAESAGLPDARGLYPRSPAELANHATRMFAAGARLVGGCCGTTPAHIAAIRARAPR